MHKIKLLMVYNCDTKVVHTVEPSAMPELCREMNVFSFLVYVFFSFFFSITFWGLFTLVYLHYRVAIYVEKNTLKIMVDIVTIYSQNTRPNKIRKERKIQYNMPARCSVRK